MAENKETVGYTAEGAALEAQEIAGTDYPTGAAAVIDDEARGAALEAQSLADGEPARVAAAPSPADPAAADERAGAALQAQELNPAEPVAAPAPAQVGYGVEGRVLEARETANVGYPEQPTAGNAAYHATYGAPQQPSAVPAPAGGPTPAPAPAAAAPRPPAPAKPKKPLDPEQIFLICGIIVGGIIIVFGLCMLAYYTPDEVGEFFDTYKMNGSVGFSSVGATAQQVLKAGFSMLLIGLGATDICAFGAKFMKSRKRQK